MQSFTMNTGQTDGFGVPGRENDRDGKSREVFLTSGQTVVLEARDPYGFWFIRWKEGKTPDELKGASYTSPTEAAKGLSQYLERERFNTKVSETKVEIPELKKKSSA